METITIDLMNYKEGSKVFKRTAVRGIIERDGKFLIIFSKYGDHKFPGGGMNVGETLEETLIREVQEETGYAVVLDSMKVWLKVYEKRKGEYDNLLEMESYYYFCEVEENPGHRNLDEYEKEYDYQVKWLRLEDVIARNESIEANENIPWVDRETMVMKKLLRANKNSL